MEILNLQKSKVAMTTVVTDLPLSRAVVGNPGVKGGNNNKDGKNGLNKVVLVPVGTAFRNTHTRQIVAQLTQENQLFLAAKGGAGGKGNAYFKSAENQTPQVAEAGGEGESFELIVGKQLLNLSIGMITVGQAKFLGLL